MEQIDTDIFIQNGAVVEEKQPEKDAQNDMTVFSQSADNRDFIHPVKKVKRQKYSKPKLHDNGDQLQNHCLRSTGAFQNAQQAQERHKGIVAQARARLRGFPVRKPGQMLRSRPRLFSPARIGLTV